MKTKHEDEELPDSSPTDELPVLSELDVVEDFDRTSVFVSLHEDTGRHYAAPLHRFAEAADEFTDTASALEHGGTDTYRVRDLRDSDFDGSAAAADRRSERTPDGDTDGPGAEVESLKARVSELTALHATLRTEAADKDASIASLEERLEATRQAVLRRDETEQQMKAQLTALQTRLTEREASLAARETRLHDADARLAAAAAEVMQRDAELAARDGRLAALEAELADRDSQLGTHAEQRAAHAAELTARDARLEAGLAELAARDAALIGRDDQLEALTTELARRDARLANLEAELADREARTGEQERRAEARERYLAKLEAEHEQAKRNLQEARDAQSALQSRRTEHEPPRHEGEDQNGAAVDANALRRSREEAATLASYIENRRVHWDDMQKQLVEQRERMAELEHELEQRASRQREAVQRAATESERVTELKSEVEKLRRLLDVRRQVPSTAAALPAPSIAATAAAPGLQAPSTAVSDSSSAPSQRDSATNLQAPLDSPDRELEKLREELDRLREGLASRESALLERDAQQQDLRERLVENQAQLDQAREAMGRLERIVVERDRALDVKNARIDSLQAELTEKLGSGPSTATTGGSGTALHADDPERFQSGSAVPAMVCLTDDAPRSYQLRKRVVTIGRSSQCDIQIATHFVSREHARIGETPAGHVIEDLGSKNGVFVNSVRVERGLLQHGDLVTIGETQFRFLRE